MRLSPFPYDPKTSPESETLMRENGLQRRTWRKHHMFSIPSFSLSGLSMLMPHSSHQLSLQHRTIDQKTSKNLHRQREYSMVSSSRQTHRSILVAENKRQTCLVANVNEVFKDLLECFCPIIKQILHMVCWWLVDYMQWKGLHCWKTNRRLLYIYAMFLVQFLHCFYKHERSLLHIFVACHVRLFVQYLTSGKAGQLWGTRSDSLQVQITPDNPPVLWMRHTWLSHKKRACTAIQHQSAGEDEITNDVLRPQHVLLFRTMRSLRTGGTRTSP